MPITLRSHTDTSGSGGLAIGEHLIDLIDVPTYDPFVRTGDMSFPLPINQWVGLNQQLNEQILELYNSDLEILGVIPVISDTAYDATSWNGNLDGASKNVIRDKFETLGTMSTQDAGSVAITGGIIGNLTALTGSQINSNDLLQNLFGGSVALGNHNFFGNESLVILDTDSLQYLTIKPGSNLSADRVFTLVTGDADRTLTMAGNATISNTNSGDQTSIVGISGTMAQFNTANSDGDFVFTSNIGSTVQAWDADLDTLASLTATTDNFIVSVASAWASRTPAQVRTTLGLVIGTNVQAYDADLTTWAGLTPSANAQSLVTAADYSAMRTLLSLRPGIDIQAYDADLATIAGLTATTDNFMVAASSAWASRTPAQARTSLGLVIGTNVQAWDTELDSLAGLGVIQGDLIYGSAANTYSKLAKDANATRYLSNQGTSNNPSWNQINLANGVTGDLPWANIVQGSALSVAGVAGNSTADFASIAAGSDHQVLRRSGTALAFGAVNLAQSAAVTGVLPSANGGVDTSAWSSYTPTITPQTGSFTTASASGRWKQIGKTVFVTITITITTNGTAGGYIKATLPTTVVNSGLYQIMGGKEISVVGATTTTIIFPNTADSYTVFYNNTSPCGSGNVVVISGTYETA